MHKSLVIWFTIIVLLTGCASTNSVNKQQNLDAKFEVAMDELVTSKEGESIILVGYLENISNDSIEISHGSDIFTYEIFDSEGNIVGSPFSLSFRNDVGYNTIIKAGKQYRNNGEGQRSTHQYEINYLKTGNYQVQATAKFKLKVGDNWKDMELQSEMYPLNVEN